MNLTATEIRLRDTQEGSLETLLATEKVREDFIKALANSKAASWEWPFANVAITHNEKMVLDYLTDSVVRARIHYQNRIRRIIQQNEHERYARLDANLHR